MTGTTFRILPGVFGFLAAADGLLFVAAASGQIKLWLALVAHSALIAAVTLELRRQGATDCAVWTIGLFATAVAGPLGAIAGLILSIAERNAPITEDLLNTWYTRKSGDHVADAASVIHDAIVTGRAVQPGTGKSGSFLALIEHGTLSQKQALLGLIGLQYHADYLPVLALALRSRDSSVRAQAAAVSVKLKEQFKTRIKRCLADPSQGAGSIGESDRLNRVRAILECTGSGFLDPVEIRHAHAVATALCEQALRAGSGGDAELLLCQALAGNCEHEKIIELLASRMHGLAPDLKILAANSLIVLGRHREVHNFLSGNSNLRPVPGQAAAAAAAAF